MNFFTEIERLINEHDSSTILKERILFLKEKHAVFVNENITHKTKIAELGTQVRQLNNDMTRLHEINEKLSFDNKQLKNQIKNFHNSGPKRHVSDHYGSDRLKSTGNRPNERFGRMDKKGAINSCLVYGKETAAMIVPSK
jgi:TolA-binding protein